VTATIFNWLYNAARWTWHDPDGYNFISGPLADVTLLGGAYAIYRHHNCHVKGCWRVGRIKVLGTPHIVCRKHHPHDKPTAQQVLDDHHAAVQALHAMRAGVEANAGVDAQGSAARDAAPGPPGG
jgi:hypothetical protein